MITQLIIAQLTLKQEEVTSNCVTASLRLPSAGQWNSPSASNCIFRAKGKHRLRLLLQSKQFSTGVSYFLSWVGFQFLLRRTSTYEFAKAAFLRAAFFSLIGRRGFFWTAGKVRKNSLFCHSCMFDCYFLRYLRNASLFWHGEAAGKAAWRNVLGFDYLIYHIALE